MILNPNPPQSQPVEPVFSPGQLINHRRYGYRGVIVDVDLQCKASEHWYQNNQTQPDRNQPWYHVLVHGSSATTYPAQDNLIADPSGEHIEHPLLAYFFSSFEENYYIRNDRPWPPD